MQSSCREKDSKTKHNATQHNTKRREVTTTGKEAQHSTAQHHFTFSVLTLTLSTRIRTVIFLGDW